MLAGVQAGTHVICIVWQAGDVQLNDLLQIQKASLTKRRMAKGFDELVIGSAALSVQPHLPLLSFCTTPGRSGEARSALWGLYVVGSRCVATSEVPSAHTNCSDAEASSAFQV